MNNDRLATYLKSLESPERPFLEQVEREALESYVPIIRKETQSFLKVILEITRPMRILEVGTAALILPRLRSMRRGSPLPGKISGKPGRMM